MILRTFFQALVLFNIISLTASDPIDVGTLSRNEGTRPIKIEVVSANPDIVLMAQKAFNLHGGYTLSSSNDDDFTFRLDQISPTQVNLSIESGFPKKNQFSRTVQGIDLQDATLQACDVAVQKTLGIPGFFSGKLAFVGKRENVRELFTSDLLFSDVHQISHDSVDIVSPKFSPDGKNIIYTSYYKTGFPDIFMINLDSGIRRTIAAYNGTNTGGNFSPDGKKIAMILTSNGNAELFTSNFSGKGLKRLTKSKGLEATPVFSPDNQYIYFSSDPMGGPQLYKMKVKGGEMKRIPTNISKYCAEPCPNPIHPNQLAFTAAVNKHFHIALYDTETKESMFISQGDNDFMEPSWLADGRHLVVTKRVGEDTMLHILDSQSGKATPLHKKEFGKSMMANFKK